MYVCTYVCTYVCMYMYVCMYYTYMLLRLYVRVGWLGLPWDGVEPTLISFA